MCFNFTRAMTAKTKRRYEPDRRDRIVDVALDVIAQYGVAGTTHRRIAELADVPLGAMTYYFDGLQSLVQEAFTKLAQTMSSQLQGMLAAAASKEEARQVIIDLVCNDLWTSPRNVVLLFELSAYAAREPSARPLLQQWMGASESYMGQHFGPSSAKILDAFIDGVVMRNIIRKDYISREEVTEFVQKITA